MALKVDYYSTLSRAVAALDRDSYAARGAIYDREHKALLRRLFSADPPHSDEDIEREQQAFRAAIRRIEFGDEDQENVPLVPQRDAAQDDSAAAPVVAPPAATNPVPPARARRGERDWAPEPVAWSPQPTAREPQRSSGTPAAESAPGPGPGPAPGRWSQRKGSVEVEPSLSPTHWSQRKPSQPLPWRELEATVDTALKDQAAPLPPPSVADGEPNAEVKKLKRKPIVGRVVRRALLAALLLGLGIMAYDFASGDVEIPGLGKLASKTSPAAKPTTAGSQAIVFDSNPPNPEGSKGVGSAAWRVRSEPATSQRAASTVLQFDLKIPDRQINLAMSMRPEEAGSSMSHLIELRFLRPDGQPDPDIDNIASVVMTTVEQQRPRVLIGRVQKVAPGVFLFGLSGVASDREQNLRFLTEETWFDIPLTYSNGASGVLAIEKGADGAQAVNQAMADWSRVAAAPSDR